MFTANDICRHSHEYGDIVLTCPVYISKGIHQSNNEQVLTYTCALLNSGGGILVMQNVEYNKGTQSKSLDSWWSGMENNFAIILSGDDICNFLDFVGNFDDKCFYLFVKSAEHLCTLDYNCRLPTDTATHCVTFKSAVKLCTRTGSSGSLSDLPPIPSKFVYGETEETLKQEGKQIQFKLLSTQNDYSKKSLADKVSYYSSKYITAFANHEGGHIYFGIEDTSAAVLGEEMTDSDEVRIVRQLTAKMESVIWGDTRFAALRGIHWDIQFFPLHKCPRQERREIIVVSVCKMYGGVFTSCPESYVVTQPKPGQITTEWKVKKLGFDEWKSELLNQSREVKPLHSRFVKIPLRTPQSRLVYSLPHTLQTSKEKVIFLSKGFNLQPRNILLSYKEENIRKTITKLLTTFAEEPHLVISLESWGLEFKLPPKPDCVKAVLAIFSTFYGLHVVSLVTKPSTNKDLWQFTSQLAANLKQILVQHGGCVSHLGFKVHVLDIGEPNILEYFQASIDIDIYPQTYKLQEQSLNDLLTALTVAIASYKPFSSSDDFMETNHYFLLTYDQLELLWTHQFTKELWIHGPPGSGKTIAALEMIRELRFHRGCQKNEVIYVAENPLLCAYVSSFDECLVASRRELMADSVSLEIVAMKYSKIKNVIVDEAQNFKDRDGDWYTFLENFSQQNLDGPNDLTAGYFWIFMDYAQKVHKFKAGLPGLIGKNNFMLREVSRNSKEIYEYASRFMDKPSEAVLADAPANACVEDSPHLAHEYESGNDVSVVKCEKSSVEDVLYKVLKQFSDSGISLNDIAILVSKKKDAQEVTKSVTENELLKSVVGQSSAASLTSESVDGKVSAADMPESDAGKMDISPGEESNITSGDQEMSMDINTDQRESSPVTRSSTSKGPLLVSTVREFSGLDKPVIIGLDPHTNQQHADLDKFLLNLVTRAKDSLVILTTSDKLMEKLKPGEASIQ